MVSCSSSKMVDELMVEVMDGECKDGAVKVYLS